MLPISRNPYVPAILIGIGAIPVPVLWLLGGAGLLPLLVNWLAAALFAWMIWDMMDKYQLSRFGSKAFIISWPLIALALNFVQINFAEGHAILWEPLLKSTAQLILLRLGLGTWQGKLLPFRFFCIGLIIGGLSTFTPRSIFWLLIMPIVFFQMRSWSFRNFWSTLTGATFAIWTAYCAYFFLAGETQANEMIAQYRHLSDLQMGLPDYESWEWLFIGLVGLQSLGYAFSGLMLNIGHNVRAHACILLISLSCLLLPFFCLAGISSLPLYLCLLSVFLSLLLSLHQSNLNSDANEWWIIISLFLSLALCLLPTIYPLLDKI